MPESDFPSWPSDKSYVTHRLSPEELYDVYTFKLIKRVLKKRFPWIKDVFVKREDLEKYNLIFLNFNIDPYEFAKKYNHEVKDMFDRLIKDGQYLDISHPHLLTDMTYEEWSSIRRQMKGAINDVMDNPSVPREYKIPGDRGVDTGTFTMNRREGSPDFIL
jgi:hypothetical protein